ncbi:MAG: hypothetical protein V1721_06245 [Pseudomonadota bacterium]
MDRSGVKTDPTTGRPVEEAIKEKERAQEKQEETLLKGQAAFQGFSESDAGTQLLIIVRSKYEARVMELTKVDPECQAYEKIVREIGVKEAMAKGAARQLFQRSLKKNEE